MASNILFIGNINRGNNACCGQKMKTIIYKNCLQEEGFNLKILDLEIYKNHLLKLLFKIKKFIIEADVVIILPGPTSAHILIPAIAFFNRKFGKRLIYSSIGTGLFTRKIKKTKEKDIGTFFKKVCDTNSKGSKIMIKSLCKFYACLYETDLLTNAHNNYYKCNNGKTFFNFRKIDNVCNIIKNKKNGKLIYLSRLVPEKGIFDLLYVVKKYNSENPDNKIKLDIYGEIDALSNEFQKEFFSYIDDLIVFKGFIDNSSVIKVISAYSLFCFPTKYMGEGIPGVLSESLIAGTPIFSSAFIQAKYILEENVDSILYEFNNIDDMYNKFSLLVNDKEKILELSRGAVMNSKKYLYSNVREEFLNYLNGKDLS